MTPNPTPASRLSLDEVVHISGPMDDVRIAAIIASGATRAELMEARRWRDGYHRSLPDDGGLRPTVVNRLCELLRTEEEEWDNP